MTLIINEDGSLTNDFEDIDFNVDMNSFSNVFINDYANLHKNAHIVMSDMDSKNTFIDLIYVDEGFKNKGFGRKLLEDVCELADKMNVTLHLEPNDGFGSDLKKLVNFYYSFGFVPCYNEMVRNVKK